MRANLEPILRSVARSFYLSLRVLPAPLREPFSVGYLLARAADTIADTDAVEPSRRIELLAGFEAAVLDPEKAPALATKVALQMQAPKPEEAALLHRLGDCFVAYKQLGEHDRSDTSRVLRTLAAGMRLDLERFSGPLKALATESELDAYCFAAAGCVGEYWSRLLAHHVPDLAILESKAMLERGVGLGKALQLVNVLRDAPRDLARGRCYWPLSLLTSWGLELEDLIDPKTRTRAKPVVRALAGRALNLLDEAWPYIEAIPAEHARLRLSVLWPQWIAFATLRALGRAADPLDPRTVIKIPRRSVYALVAESAALARFTPALELANRLLRAQVLL